MKSTLASILCIFLKPTNGAVVENDPKLRHLLAANNLRYLPKTKPSAVGFSLFKGQCGS